MTLNKRQYDLMYSLRSFLIGETGIPCDIVYDGYKKRKDKPYTTVEQMQNNNEYNTKLREAVETTYRFQIGLHASKLSEKSKLQEDITRVLLFDKVPYFNTELSLVENVGRFSVNVMAVVPMPSDDLSDVSGHHTVYFDVEINDTKRRC